MTATASEPSGPAGGGEGVDVSRAVEPWRWSHVLTDSAGVLAVVWSLPLAILFVGTPIALTIVLLLWVARFALGAF